LATGQVADPNSGADAVTPGQVHTVAAVTMTVDNQAAEALRTYSDTSDVSVSAVRR
jgi:hypothetical protein